MNIKEYIESGILEQYVLGLTSEEENIIIAKISNEYPDVNNEIERITFEIITIAEQNVINDPNETVKPIVMASVEYIERLKLGEAPSFPPSININSKIDDYSEWLGRPDMMSPVEYDNIFAKIIGYTNQLFTAIVWIKDYTPYEVHGNEFEKFLVVEGSCDIITDAKTYQLKVGDSFKVPLHMGHTVKVTSAIPCKVILQREAA